MLFLTLFVLSVTITIVTTVVGQLRIWQVNRKFTLSHGAKRPLRLSRWQNIKQQITNLKRHTWLDMWCERYSTVGTTFESASVSLDQIIFTIDPENIKAILATDFKTFGLGERRRNLLGPLIGTGIFTADGQAWEHSRSLIRPSFTKMRISDLSVFEKHFQDLMTALPGVDEHSGLIDADLAPLFFRMTLDSATEVLLGRSLCSLSSSADSDALRFMEAFDYAQLKIHTRDLLARGYMKPLGILVSLLKYNRESRFDQACQTVHSFVDKIIGDYLQSSTSGSGETCTKNYVFLDALAAVNRNPVGLRYEVLNVLVAGRDTTASLLSNVFFVLARRPDIWVQLKEEVAETFGQSLPDYDGLRNMKKLKNVLSECKSCLRYFLWKMSNACRSALVPPRSFQLTMCDQRYCFASRRRR